MAQIKGTAKMTTYPGHPEPSVTSSSDTAPVTPTSSSASPPSVPPVRIGAMPDGLAGEKTWHVC